MREAIDQGNLKGKERAETAFVGLVGILDLERKCLHWHWLDGKQESTRLALAVASLTDSARSLRCVDVVCIAITCSAKIGRPGAVGWALSSIKCVDTAAAIHP